MATCFFLRNISFRGTRNRTRNPAKQPTHPVISRNENLREKLYKDCRFRLRSYLRRFLVPRNELPENILMKTALAQIEVESPELKTLIFLARRQRPAEARFMA